MPGQFPNREYDSDATAYDGPTTTTGMQTRSTTAKKNREKYYDAVPHFGDTPREETTGAQNEEAGMRTRGGAANNRGRSIQKSAAARTLFGDASPTFQCSSSYGIQPSASAYSQANGGGTPSIHPTGPSGYNLRTSAQSTQAHDGPCQNRHDASQNSDSRYVVHSSERDPHGMPHWTSDQHRSPSASSDESRSRSRSRSPNMLDINRDPRGRHCYQGRRRKERKVVNTNAIVDLGPFYGKENEDFDEWILQLRAAMDMSEIADHKKIKVLTVKLKGKAFTHFQQLKPPHNQTFEAAVTALQKTFVNPNQHLKYRIRFSKRNFRMGEESIENYAAVLTKIASLAFKNKADAEARVADRFVEGLPNRLKKKCLMFQDKPLTELLEYVSKLLVIDEYCPGEEAGAFNAITPAKAGSEHEYRIR